MYHHASCDKHKGPNRASTLSWRRAAVLQTNDDRADVVVRSINSASAESGVPRHHLRQRARISAFCFSMRIISVAYLLTPHLPYDVSDSLLWNAKWIAGKHVNT